MLPFSGFPGVEKIMALTPFGYITGPFYVYVISRWVGSNLEPIYVGRGKARRATAYFKFGRSKGRPSNNNSDFMDFRKYICPETHNKELNKVIEQVRRDGREVTIIAYDCYGSKERSQSLEKELIERYGRRDLNSGTLLNKNSGG